MDNETFFSGFIISKEIGPKERINGLNPVFEVDKLQDGHAYVELSWEGDISDVDLSLLEVFRNGSTTETSIIIANETSGFGRLLKLMIQLPESFSQLNYLVLRSGKKLLKAEPFVLVRANSTEYNPRSLCKSWHMTQPDPTPIMMRLPPCW